MIGYKLMRKMRNGYAPLFINKKQRLQLGHTYEAEIVPTKGYAFRPGWHCLFKPLAPHLTNKGRVWVKVEMHGYEIQERPEEQGGRWALSQRITLLEEVDQFTELMSWKESILKRNEHWKSCQDGSYELALVCAGLPQIEKQLELLK